MCVEYPLYLYIFWLIPRAYFFSLPPAPPIIDIMWPALICTYMQNLAAFLSCHNSVPHVLRVCVCLCVCVQLSFCYSIVSSQHVTFFLVLFAVFFSFVICFHFFSLLSPVNFMHFSQALVREQACGCVYWCAFEFNDINNKNRIRLMCTNICVSSFYRRLFSLWVGAFFPYSAHLANRANREKTHTGKYYYKQNDRNSLWYAARLKWFE